MQSRDNVLRPFPEATRGAGKPCSIYVIGYEHATFGHALKVGISARPSTRVADLQVGNPDEIKTYLVLNFERRAIAQEVEALFHENKLGSPIRGEWVACSPYEAIMYLSFIVARVLQRTYPDKEILRRIRKQCGLVAAFDLTDRNPSILEVICNERWSEWVSDRRKGHTVQ